MIMSITAPWVYATAAPHLHADLEKMQSAKVPIVRTKDRLSMAYKIQKNAAALHFTVTLIEPLPYSDPPERLSMDRWIKCCWITWIDAGGYNRHDGG